MFLLITSMQLALPAQGKLALPLPVGSRGAHTNRHGDGSWARHPTGVKTDVGRIEGWK